MTDQADLKARVEELRRVAEAARDEIGSDATKLALAGGDPFMIETDAEDEFHEMLTPELVLSLLSRITDLEAERDDVLKFAGCDSLSQLASAYSTAQANWDLTLDRAEAAESRLALAEKVVEAGRPGDLLARSRSLAERAPLGHWTNGKDGELLWELCEFVRELSAALTAYEENTSSKDLTTGEDDA